MPDIDLEQEPTRARAPGERPDEAKASPLSPLRPVWIVLRDATGGLFRHDGLMVASAIAYSLIFALFPFAIFVVALGAMFGGAELAAYVRSEAIAAFPTQVIDMIEPELERVLVFTGRASPLTFGLLVTLISITGAVEAVRGGLNRAYGCAEDRHLLRRYLSSLLFVFLGMAFLLSVAALGVVVPIVIDMLHRYVPETQLDLPVLEFGRQALLALVTAAMLFALHLLLPARRRRVSSVIGGVLFTLVCWWLAARLFGLYISEVANYSATYAGLAGIVVLMLFLYIQAFILLYGAEVNRSIGDYRGAALCRSEA